MNKTFNINLGGYPFAIDEDAFEYIQNYLDTIRRHFSASEGCEEILYDIEVRMAELFQEHLKGRAIISMKEIDEVILIMGKPEDFGAEPMSEQFSGNTKGKKSSPRINTGKKLFRDPDDTKLAGVCSGIAAYLGIEDPLWLRIFFVLTGIFSGGFIFVVYMVLWFLVPEAASASDKLAMRGEPATISNIAKVVEEELNELGDKITEWSKDFDGSKKKSGNTTGSNTHQFKARAVLADGVNLFGTVASGFIPVIRGIIKPIFITVAILAISVLGISWAASFVGLTFASPVLRAVGPDSSFLSTLGIVSLYFTVGLFILGIILYIARIAFSYRVNKHVHTGLWTVWFLSLFTTMFAGMSTVKEYQSRHELKTLTDYNIGAQDILITMPDENLDQNMGVSIGEFFTKSGNNWAIKDVNVQVEKSKDAFVHIEKKISSRGEELSDAQQNTLFVGNDIKVNGGEISISKYLTIPKDRKYRNQAVDYVIYIPEGKNVIFDNSVRGRLRHSSLVKWDQIYSSEDNMKWTVKGDGVYSKEYDAIHHFNKEVSTGNYNKVIVENGFDVIIKKADKPSAHFTGNKSLVEKLSFKNLDGTLSIQALDADAIEDVTIHIETPSLELVQLHGVKSATIEGFNQDNLKLLAKDSENGFYDNEIKISGNIKNLDISMDGNQNLNLTGSGESLNATLNDGANIYADKYIVNKATINGNHTHESSFYIQQQLKCEYPDQINFKVYGNPKKEKI